MDEPSTGLGGLNYFLNKWCAIDVCYIPPILSEEVRLKVECQGVPLGVLGEDIGGFLSR